MPRMGVGLSPARFSSTFAAFVVDGEHGQVALAVVDDCHLLITSSVQLYV